MICSMGGLIRIVWTAFPPLVPSNTSSLPPNRDKRRPRLWRVLFLPSKFYSNLDMSEEMKLDYHSCCEGYEFKRLSWGKFLIHFTKHPYWAEITFISIYSLAIENWQILTRSEFLADFQMKTRAITEAY